MALSTFTRQGSRPKPYTIQLRDDGRLSCDCPAWLNKRNGQPRGCKHCVDVAANDVRKAIEQREDGQYVRGGAVLNTPATKALAQIAGDPLDKRNLAAARAIIDPPQYRPLMLADKVEDFRWSNYPAALWAMEQKFDGERCLACVRSGVVTAWSRAGGGRDVGLARDLAPQIVAALAALPDGDYDGEVIVKGVGLMSSDVRALVNRAQTVFVVFDVLRLGERDFTGLPYRERRAYLTQMVKHSAALIYPTSVAPDRAMYDAILAAGGEGVILKRLDSLYSGRRDGAAWVKVKQQHEEVVTVIGFEDSKVNSGKNAVILFRMASGVESKCKTLNADWWRRIAKGEIAVGTKIEVTYQVLMASGKPRHAMAKRVVGDA